MSKLTDAQILAAMKGAPKVQPNYAGWVTDQRIAHGRAVIAAHEAAKQPPESFKLAPIEPTPEMAAAAQRWVAAGVEAVYRAMLAAAP